MNLELNKARLKMALQNNSAKRVKLSNKGTVVPSRLAHYRTSDLIYCEPIPNTGKEYSMDILIDVSGSMFQTKETNRILGAINSAKELVRLLYGIVDFRIILFGKGFKSISMNELLSIQDEDLKDFEKSKSLFDRTSLLDLGNGTAVSCEGYGFSGWTNYTMAIQNSLVSFEGKQGGKYIALITDGDENTSLSSFDKINGINVVSFSRMKENLRQSDVSILPIGIDIDISYSFDGAINLRDSSRTQEEVIKFLEKNI